MSNRLRMTDFIFKRLYSVDYQSWSDLKTLSEVDIHILYSEVVSVYS